MFSSRYLRLCSRVRGSVKSGVFVQLCDENRSGGLGKSSREVSESTVHEDGESRGRFWSKYGSGVEKVDRQVSVWSRAAAAADTQEEAAARCAGAGPRLPAARDDEMVLGGSMVESTGEVRVGMEEVGGS